VNGKTFRWSGEYSWDLNTRQTRSIDLNVFKDFKPELPETYRQTDFVLLANIAPSLQTHVLEKWSVRVSLSPIQWIFGSRRPGAISMRCFDTLIFSS